MWSNWYRFVGSLRRPEYTGDNRCLPCTALNLGIAGLVSAVVTPSSPAVGAVVFGSSLVVIYLRGYLVPGTPTLTRRYFPTRLLRLFDKGPAAPGRPPMGTGRSPDATDPSRGGPDPIALLDGLGVLRECPDRDDLCLTEGFDRSWREALETVRDDRSSQREALAATLRADLDPSRVSFRERDHEFSAVVGDATVGSWLSEAAFVADMAAARALAPHVDRADIDAQSLGSILGRLRLFIEECPVCATSLTFEADAQKACCWSRRVTTLRCPDCEVRLLELDELEFDDGHTEYV
jgi:hypothetical protein